jgi:hypothetical protein
MISSITASKFTPPRERDDLEGTEEIVPYGGSTGCVIGARKIHELAGFWRSSNDVVTRALVIA